MLTIDWIRHTSLLVTGTTAYGQSDLPVASTFEIEAEAVREVLSERQYDRVFTSPLSRAKKLCEYCGYYDAVVDPRLMERNFGEWEMKPWEEVYSIIAKHPDSHLYGDRLELMSPPGGESVDALTERVGNFVQEVRMQRWTRIAVFCHGGVINSARYWYGEIDLEHLFTHVPHYGTVTSLVYPYLDEKIIRSRKRM